MNGKERIALAMRHQEADRVPVMSQLTLGHYFLNAGLAPHEIWFTSEGFAEALVTMQRRYQFDGILINIPGRPRNVLDEIKKIEKIKKGELVTWKNGHVTLIPWDDNAQYVYTARPELQPRADLSVLDPDHLEMIHQYPGYVWNTYHIPWIAGKNDLGPLSEVPDYFYDTIDQVRAKTNGEVSVHGEVFSPFTHYLELIGYQNAIIGLVKNRDKVKALLDRLTEAAIAWAVGQARHGVDAVLISSAFAGGGFISPKMYAEFVLPYEQRLADAVRECDVPVYTHTCGKIGDRLELMEQTHTMGIDTLDPHPLGNVELSDAKNGVGQRLFLKGNMNSVSLLEYTTMEQVIAEASERIRIGMPGGGYIFSTSNCVYTGMALRRYELILDLWRREGRY